MIFMNYSTCSYFVLRLTSARLLALSSQLSAKSTGDSEVKDVPIKFSTSKASHKTWKVNNSLGSQHEQPWWKAICISLFFISTILWCLLRKETDVDRKLEQSIFEPSDDEKEE